MIDQLATEPTLRVLQKEGVRLPIKLEHIFWIQLEELAAESNLTLAKYVHKILKGADAHANRASWLRCHCLRLAREQKVAAELREGDVNMTLMLTACPSPAFILKDERTIIAHNPAFADRFMQKDGQDIEERSFVKISYTRPFGRLLEFLQQNPNKALNTLLVLSTRASTVNIRARLMLVGPPQQPFVLAFLEQDAHGQQRKKSDPAQSVPELP